MHNVCLIGAKSQLDKQFMLHSCSAVNPFEIIIVTCVVLCTSALC